MIEKDIKKQYENIAKLAVDVASDRLGSDIVLLDTSDVSSFSDYFVIISAETDRHVDSIANDITRAIRDEKIHRTHKEGSGSGGWMILEFSGLVVHIFKKNIRQYYDLEGLWNRAKEILRLQ